jgi:hypothetical protein
MLVRSIYKMLKHGVEFDAGAAARGVAIVA